ncbi:zinc finger CCCH domain-containing protein 3 [Pyrus x bretschneideri]|uniref:zinc finger CCCH domain-containing protein 3 n=1 Tax=Pyrus x bretschneideri TaxID=225117 RepID=UPI00202EACFF|nr:zinc finger CCCH domain-containing protein 3 [Pyrus x bretschneideri]XP_048439407.1 zinc finger CCCH domain-containing protein 3 [Pyrus x bretschneideri]XP_048439409.1 zinc finger CCCH domain-containing protein 3 [Pyrus x bretschneideri]
MPMGKYFCDYCEKEFQDTPPSRRRHLQSGQHLRARAQWYASFKDPNHAYPTKGVCNRFVNTGSCPYGDSCKYLHPKNNQQDTVLIDNNQSSSFQENQSVGGSSLPDVVVRDHTGTSWSNLPPSLMPPPEGGHPRLPFVDWG